MVYTLMLNRKKRRHYIGLPGGGELGPFRSQKGMHNSLRAVLDGFPAATEVEIVETEVDGDK